MNARAVDALSRVIHASMQRKQTAAGIAADVDAAGMLMSRETAAELAALREHPEPLPDDQFAEIRARAEAATPGPWCTDDWEIYQGAEYQPGLSEWIGETCRGKTTVEQDRADAAFIAAARTDVPVLLDHVTALEQQRERRRIRLIALQNDALDMRGALSPNGQARKVPMQLGETLLPAVEWLIARVSELELERHSTNEALSDAVAALRERDARIAELEAQLPPKSDVVLPARFITDAMANVPQSLPRCPVCTFVPAYCTCFGKTHQFDPERLGVSDAKRRLANCVGCGQPRSAACHTEGGEPQ